MFIDVDSSAASEYLSVQSESILLANPSTEYKAHARLENLASD